MPKLIYFDCTHHKRIFVVQSVEMKRVLFVCLGNICRSPMAEGVFNKLVKERGLEKEFACDSAGTAGYHIGELPDYRTRKVCDMNDTPLQHRGRKLSPEDIHDFDLLLAMDQANYYDILHQLGINEEKQEKVRLLRSYEASTEMGEVPDPYYGDMDDFKNVYSMLEKACGALLDELTKK